MGPKANKRKAALQDRTAGFKSVPPWGYGVSTVDVIRALEMIACKARDQTSVASQTGLRTKRSPAKNWRGKLGLREEKCPAYTVYKLTFYQGRARTRPVHGPGEPHSVAAVPRDPSARCAPRATHVQAS